MEWSKIIMRKEILQSDTSCFYLFLIAVSKARFERHRRVPMPWRSLSSPCRTFWSDSAFPSLSFFVQHLIHLFLLLQNFFSLLSEKKEEIFIHISTCDGPPQTQSYLHVYGNLALIIYWESDHTFHSGRFDIWTKHVPKLVWKL